MAAAVAHPAAAPLALFPYPSRCISMTFPLSSSCCLNPTLTAAAPRACVISCFVGVHCDKVSFSPSFPAIDGWSHWPLTGVFFEFAFTIISFCVLLSSILCFFHAFRAVVHTLYRSDKDCNSSSPMLLGTAAAHDRAARLQGMVTWSCGPRHAVCRGALAPLPMAVT